MYATLGNSS